MMKKISKSIVLILSVFLLTGCWDYVGLNEMTIVTGMAIDMDEVKNKYKLSFEIVDLGESSKEKTVKTEIIESVGDTIFDAVRNAKKRVMSKLYFGNTQVIVISNQIAKKYGISSITNWFLRDAELRETSDFVISQEDTAKEILTQSVVDYSITSYEIKKIVRNDNAVTSSTKGTKIYQIFNTLKDNGCSLVLPLFHTVKNEKVTTLETSGIATFNKDKLIGYLNAIEAKYFLFIDNSVDGGILALDSNDDGIDDISLEIAESSASKTYSYSKDKFKFSIVTNTNVYLAEYANQSKPLDEKKINSIQKEAEMMIEKNIKKIIKKAKDEFKTDIFSLGHVVFKNDPKLWKKEKKNWDTLFIDSDIDVKSTVKILNTAFIK